MSDLPRSALIPPTVSLVKGADRSKRRHAAIWVVAAAALVTAGTSLWVWEPWVDRSPFTALVAGVTPMKDAESATDGSECTPNLAGETMVVYDASGKRKLASAVEPSVGQVLPSLHSVTAKWCFSATRIEGVPGGEGTYKVQTGGGNLVTMKEEHLREPVDQQREAMKETRLPPYDAPPPELPSVQ